MTSIFPTSDPAYDATYAQEAVMVDASELIAHALEQAGMSRSELAEKLGVNRSEITARLRGERNISIRKLAATLHVLGKRLTLSVADESVPQPRDRYEDWASITRDRFPQVKPVIRGTADERAREFVRVARKQA